MRCDDVRDLILIPSRPDDAAFAQSTDPSIADHILSCDSCSSFARRMEKVDLQLRGALRVAPPMDLQASLIAMALEHAASVQIANAPAMAARVRASRTSAHAESMAAVGVSAIERTQERVVTAPAPQNSGSWLFETRFWSVVAAFGLFAAAVLQIAGWFSTMRFEIGDIFEGVSILAASPASQYLGDLGINLPSLALWSAIGISLWIAMRMGLIDQPSREPV